MLYERNLLSLFLALWQSFALCYSNTKLKSCICIWRYVSYKAKSLLSWWNSELAQEFFQMSVHWAFNKWQLVPVQCDSRALSCTAIVTVTKWWCFCFGVTVQHPDISEGKRLRIQRNLERSKNDQISGSCRNTGTLVKNLCEAFNKRRFEQGPEEGSQVCREGRLEMGMEQVNL